MVLVVERIHVNTEILKTKSSIIFNGKFKSMTDKCNATSKYLTYNVQYTSHTNLNYNLNFFVICFVTFR